MQCHIQELKKLDFYHYTFKKDEAKTPMVGVMVQDLQKVFPDAVTKGDDGYLRIRLEVSRACSTFFIEHDF